MRMDDFRMPSSDELWESGCRDIDATIDAMRSNFLDRGLEDSNELENILDGERVKMQEELGRNIDGDLEFSYEMPDFDELAEKISSRSDIQEQIENYGELSDQEVSDICDSIAGGNL